MSPLARAETILSHLLIESTPSRRPHHILEVQRHFREEVDALAGRYNIRSLFRSLWCCPDDRSAVGCNIQQACDRDADHAHRIVFRALQGIGGAGNYSLSTVILMELVPSDKYAALTTFVSLFYSMSLLLGPILGGVINQNTTWRWIFLLK